MKRKYLLLSFMLVAVLGILNTTKVNSHIIYPPYGSCGDPVNPATCAQSGCHGGSNQAVLPNDASIRIGADTSSFVTLNSNFKYTPGATYYISFSVLLQNYVSGFQMTVLNPNTSMAGSFTQGPNTHLISGPPDYIGHVHANHNVSSWIYQWTAPATDSTVTFYYAFNSGDSADFYANNNSGIPDSNIFVGQTTIQSNPMGIEDISGKISGLEVYPNPVNDVFGLSFNMLNAGMASASVYTVDGKLCRQIFNERLNAGAFSRAYDMSSFAAGIYLLKLNIDGAMVTKKLIKE